MNYWLDGRRKRHVHIKILPIARCTLIIIAFYEHDLPYCNIIGVSMEFVRLSLSYAIVTLFVFILLACLLLQN